MEKFWNKYIDADSLERGELLKPVLVRLIEACEMDLEEPHKSLVISNLLMSYFDDLISVMYSRENQGPDE